MDTPQNGPDRADASVRTIAGRYRVIERLGQGAMAVVYRAADFETGRDVAVKVLLPKRLKQARHKERFLIEARAAHRIRHLNVVEVLDWGETAARQPYLAMEYLRGESLARFMRRRHIVPWREAASIVLQICSAMEAAHAADVIHRDLKPGNIALVGPPSRPPAPPIVGCVARENAAPLVKVLDFGLAKLLHGPDARKLTRTGLVVGTPAFVAPEQIHGAAVDQRTDIYGLGTILYRMICGEMPFRAANVMDLMRKHLSERPRSPAEVNPIAPIPPGAGEIALRALAKSPEDRFPSMAELARAIEAIE